MNTTVRLRLASRKRSIAARLARPAPINPPEPVFAGGNTHYEMGERQRGLAYGGIGLMQQLVRELGLAEAIDQRLHVFKVHLERFTHEVMRGPSPLPPGQRELIAALTSKLNQCLF